MLCRFFCVLRSRHANALFALYGHWLGLSSPALSVSPFLYHRNLSLAGAVVLLLAESIVESRSLFPGLPAADSESAAKQYMQLGGRLLIVLMFVNVLQFGLSPIQLLQAAVAIALMGSVAIGKHVRYATPPLLSALSCRVALHLWSYDLYPI